VKQDNKPLVEVEEDTKQSENDDDNNTGIEKEKNSLLESEKLKMQEKFVKVFQNWKKLEEDGFNCTEHYFNSNSNNDDNNSNNNNCINNNSNNSNTTNKIKTFTGIYIHDVPLLQTMTSTGFSFYFNRACLLQKLVNIILILSSGGGISVICESIMILLSLLICFITHYYNFYHSSIASVLPKLRIYLNIIEFILLCITLGIASTNENVNNGLLFFIGIMNQLIFGLTT
jgi:hypothetical protein